METQLLSYVWLGSVLVKCCMFKAFVRDYIPTYRYICIYIDICICNIMFFITNKLALFRYCTQEWEGSNDLSSLSLVRAPHMWRRMKYHHANKLLQLMLINDSPRGVMTRHNHQVGVFLNLNSIAWLWNSILIYIFFFIFVFLIIISISVVNLFCF